MACCCKPIVAKGRVIIGSWYKDSKGRTYQNFYNCWRIKLSDNRRERIVLDRDYTWLGGSHHGGYSKGCLLGIERKSRNSINS